MDEATKRRVLDRAKVACEYCRRPQALSDLPFAIDHIIARQHGGSSELENLAAACRHCNSHKGPNIAGMDPISGRMTRLFHPRRDKWVEHFQWAGVELIGVTDVGRTTIAVLAINDDHNLQLRTMLVAEGLFPPPIDSDEV